ncbi:hypothetical protein SDC9_110885 [bioreactor metagenome]|uniref:Uncharacterized protein n=1 Tax=bioreactor metagenome TaxID=1076179 RepID=A0A645BEX2_9ZZZZ
MKKKIYYILIILVFIYGGFSLYSRPYTIADDKKQLEASIVKFINRPIVITENVEIKQELNLHNKKFVLFSYNNKLASVELIKGLNNKYKIEKAELTDKYFYDEIRTTNDGKYLILKGKNYNSKIAYVRVLLDNNEYKIDIPQQEYFITYCKVPMETEKSFIEVGILKIYNSEDIDITEEMNKTLVK